MKRNTILCIALISLPAISDALVDYQFRHQNTSYSQSAVAGMNRLVERVTTAKPARHKKVWTAKQEVAAVASLFGREGIR